MYDLNGTFQNKNIDIKLQFINAIRNIEYQNGISFLSYPTLDVSGQNEF